MRPVSVHGALSLQRCIFAIAVITACGTPPSTLVDAYGQDGAPASCGNGTIDPSNFVPSPYGGDYETCDDGDLNGTRDSLCTQYCESGALALEILGRYPMPEPATSVFTATGIDTPLSGGFDVVTTRWDDGGIQLLFDVDRPTRRVPERLFQTSRPTGIAIGGSYPAKVYWIEAYNEKLGATKMYVADASISPPFIKEVAYPFPDAAGGQLYLSSGTASILALDYSRQTPPHLLVATYDFESDRWRTPMDLGPGPGMQVRFTAARHGNFIPSRSTEWNLFWFFDRPMSFATARISDEGFALGPSEQFTVNASALEMGNFHDQGTTEPIVLSEDKELFVWDYSARAPEEGRQLYVQGPTDTVALATADIDLNGVSDAVLLRSSGSLAVFVNNGGATSMAPQEFPLSLECTTCSLLLEYRGDRSFLATSDTELIMFLLRPSETP